jgi:hypothetical protein
MKRTIILPALITAFVALSPVGVALADNPHDGNPSATGQPGKEESDNPDAKPPGHSSDGFLNVATQHYAGEQPQNSKNPKSVSQYDVAGFQFCTHRGNCDN